jgi:hypothetical protein
MADHVTLMRSLYDAFGKGDIPTVVAAMDPKKLDSQFTHHWTLRDGKIVRFQQYTDTAQAQQVVAAA